MKKIFFVLVIFIGLTSILNATDFRNDLVLLYSRGGPERIRQMETIAQRYSIGISGTPDDLNIIRSINPNFLWFVYNSVQDDYVSGYSTQEYEYVINRANQLELNPEVNYLHYYDDTRVILENDTLFIPGWRGGSAIIESEARVPVYYKNKSRIAVNYNNEYSRLFHKEYACSVITTIPEGSNVGTYSGTFWDNSAYRFWNFGRIVSGGHIVEHPNHAYIDSLDIINNNWYWDQLKTFHQEFMDTLKHINNQFSDYPKYSMINIANSWIDDYAIDNISNYLMREACFNPIKTWTSFLYSSYSQDSLATSYSVHIVYLPKPYTHINRYFGSYTYQEALLGNLCWFYITSSNLSYFYQQGTNSPGYPSWDTLVWCGIMNYDIGNPLENKYKITQAGIDGRGYVYTVFTRKYQNATIYLRPRGRWDEHIDELTKIKVELDKSQILKEIMPDGNLSKPIKLITLRNGQGKIVTSINNNILKSIEGH